MNNLRGVSEASVDAKSCGILPNYAILLISDKTIQYCSQVIEFTRLVPRAGLEPARPLFTKLRILNPVKVSRYPIRITRLFKILKTTKASFDVVFVHHGADSCGI